MRTNLDHTPTPVGTSAACSLRFRVCRSLALLGLMLLLATGTGCSLSSRKPLPDDMGPGANAPLVKTALSQVGVRYRLGGTSPQEGFDCSGLIAWTYQQYGVKLPRTAGEQMQVGREVGKNSLEPGDIVGFRIGRGRHTGLYVGRGYFVHSPGSGKQVCVESLNTNYWSKYFDSGRRPANKR